MAVKSLRAWLQTLGQRSVLRVVNREVDRRYELSAVAKKADGRYALRFNHVRGFDIPVVTGIAHSRELMALAMGVRTEKVAERFAWAQANPRPWVAVPSGQAPVKSRIARPDLTSLPIPVHHEKDGGAFITAGLVIAKDPSSGIQNVSIHRLQVFSRLPVSQLPPPFTK